jgi:hypothetical protein
VRKKKCGMFNAGSFLCFNSHHVISSVLWWQLLFPCKSDVRFVSTPYSFVGDSFCYLSYWWCVTYTGVQHYFMLSEFLFFHLHVCTDVGLCDFRQQSMGKLCRWI